MAKSPDSKSKVSADENSHKGHRNRLRNQFLANGLDSFYDHQALELLLFYAIPRSDTNPVAHALINRFGSISNILNASYEDLLTVDGVGESTACFLKILPEFFRKYLLSRIDGEKLETTEDLCRYFLYKLYAVQVEQLWLTFLDDKLGIVSSVKISEGNGSSVALDVCKIVTEAPKKKCTRCVLAHNHPFGDAKPSEDDERLTECVRTCLGNMGIVLIDHIIVSGTEASSMFYNDVVKLEDDLGR